MEQRMRRFLPAVFAAAVAASCVAGGGVERTESAQDPIVQAAGLSVRFLNGSWNEDLSAFPDPERPTVLRVADGPSRFLDELYVVSSLPTTEQDGISPVIEGGDLSDLDWSGLEQVGEDWRVEPSGATFQRQTFYRGAAWMEDSGKVKVKAVSASGTTLSHASYRTGKDGKWKEGDDFFERRFVARVLSSGCASEGDCSNPEALHVAEARVQLHSNLHAGEETFEIPPQAASLRLEWDACPGCSWTVPVTHEAAGATGYGFRLDLELVDAPARGHYLPGEEVRVRRVFRDGAGNLLFAPGFLPSYGDVLHRRPASKGLRYLTFLGTPMLYWAQKDPQGAMETFLAGPLDAMTGVATTPITPASLGLPEIPAATVAEDGWSSSIQETPVTPFLFGCLIYNFGCDFPVDEIFSFHVPADALPGTWVTGTKARREWSGEPVQRAASLEIQVGSPDVTEFPKFEVPGLSPCKDCHSDETSVKRIGHGFKGNKVGPECLACHTDGYYFEPDAGILTRLQYLHGQSDRLDPP